MVDLAQSTFPAVPLTPPEPALALRGVALAPALHPVDLEVDFGETVAVLGDDDEGKRALVRCLKGEATPTAGERTVAGPVTATGPIRIADGTAEVLAALADDGSWATVLVTDDADLAAVADRAIVLREGHVVDQGLVDRLIRTR